MLVIAGMLQDAGVVWVSLGCIVPPPSALSSLKHQELSQQHFTPSMVLLQQLTLLVCVICAVVCCVAPRYIQQLEREELSRSRALAQLRKELAADARHGRNFRQGGGVANRLVSAWLPLLAQAIEEEQVQVRDEEG
jgi:hypothetical protein